MCIRDSHCTNRVSSSLHQPSLLIIAPTESPHHCTNRVSLPADYPNAKISDKGQSALLAKTTAKEESRVTGGSQTGEEAAGVAADVAIGQPLPEGGTVGFFLSGVAADVAIGPGRPLPEGGSVGFFLSALTGSPRTPGSPHSQTAGPSRIPGYAPPPASEGAEASAGAGSVKAKSRRSSVDSPMALPSGDGSGVRSTGSGGGSLASMRDAAMSERERGWRLPSAHPPENPRLFLNSPGDSPGEVGGGVGPGEGQAQGPQRSRAESHLGSVILPMPPSPSDPVRPAWKMPNAHPNIIGAGAPASTGTRAGTASTGTGQRGADDGHHQGAAPAVTSPRGPPQERGGS